MLVPLNDTDMILTVARTSNKIAFRQLLIKEDCTGLEVLQAGNLNT